MRHVVLYLFLLFPLTGYAAPSDPTCAVETETYNSKEVLCTIPQTAKPRSYEFTVRFSGGHDDTSASIRRFPKIEIPLHAKIMCPNNDRGPADV